MKKINVLDCTLRDGGYCNAWKFGNGNIKKIINGLEEAKVNIIECGYLTAKTLYDSDCTMFTELEQITDFITPKKKNTKYVVMINFGDYQVENIPDRKPESVDGIRLAFHKKDVIAAIEACKVLIKKGYDVFVQPMISLNYSDEEFLKLIQMCNDMNPFAFYIVDSFGVMKRKDLVRLYSMVEHNLSVEIKIGYHAHNNMQLAYSNAQTLVDTMTRREMIIDACIYGMGRGAGNLNTELFLGYLNDNIETNYVIKPLLTVIDDVLARFYQLNYWGYSLPNYLSASYNIHPNYAGYLSEKQTLTIENMDDIFSMMNPEKKASFDKEYIRTLYIKYMAKAAIHEERLNELKAAFAHKDALIIAPGKSVSDEAEKVRRCIQEKNVVSIGVNFDYPICESDYIFVSNLRRFRELNGDNYAKCIVTSNIPTVDAYIQTDYKSLLNTDELVADNAILMLIQFLINIGVKKIYVAGLDGFSADPKMNFADESMSFVTTSERFSATNEGISKILSQMSKQVDIEFVTSERYITIQKESF